MLDFRLEQENIPEDILESGGAVGFTGSDIVVEASWRWSIW